MNEFQAYLNDATYPQRQTIDITFDDRFGTDEIDHLPDVIVLTTASGEHAVICPYVIPGALQLEVAVFDVSGRRRDHRIIGSP